MVSVLAIRPKVCGLKPGQGNGFLRVIKVCSTPSFRGEVKPEAPCRKVLWHEKYHLQVWTEILNKAKFSSHLPIPPACYQMSLLVGLLESSGGQIRVFPVNIMPPWFTMLIYHLWDEQQTRWWDYVPELRPPTGLLSLIQNKCIRASYATSSDRQIIR
jgi:hypothetical protein